MKLFNCLRLITVVLTVSMGVLAQTPGPFGGLQDGVNSPVLFDPATQVTAGLASHMAAADLNGDSKADAVIGGTNGGIGVYLGDGTGRLVLAQSISLPAEVNVIVTLADLNGDGKPDLVATDGGDSNMYVYLNDGTGHFGAPKTYSIGAPGIFIIAADVNADGRMDILVDSNINNLQVFTGNGDGTLTHFSSYNFAVPVSYGATYAGAVADLNGDGKVDLVISNSCPTALGGTDCIVLLLNDGKGNFTLKQNLPTGVFPQVDSIAVADLNRDGHPDIVIAYQHYFGGDVPVQTAYGKGDGTVGPLSLIYSLGVNTPPSTQIGYGTTVRAADLDGDGYPDLVVSDGDTGLVYLLHNNAGLGTFTVNHVLPGSTGTASVVMADFDGDGIPDILTSQFALNTVKVYPGKASGLFVSPSSFLFSQGSQLCANNQLGGMTALDINRDGVADIISGTATTGLSAQLSQPDGSYQTTTNVFSLGGAVLPSYPLSVLAAGDFNGDGRPDLLLAYFRCGSGTGPSQMSVGVAINNGDSTFTPPAVWTSSLSITNGPTSVKVLDINNDGYLDVVIGGSYQPYSNSEKEVTEAYLGNGAGSFVVSPVEGGIEFLSFDLADVNGDGLPDLIESPRGYAAVSVALNTGNGSFGPLQPLLPPLSAYSTVVYSNVAAGDFSGDGHPDIAVLTTTASTVLNGTPTYSVTLLRNDGKGNFPSTNIGVTPNLQFVPGDFRAEDLNNDGNADLILLSQGPPSLATSLQQGIVVMLGNGNMTFAAPASYSPGAIGGPSLGYPSKMTITDANGDGYQDILVPGFNIGEATEATSATLLANLTGAIGVLKASASSLASAQPLVLTAVLAPTVTGGAVPTGAITFIDGGAAVGTAPISSGTATLSLSSIAPGSHIYSAKYSGNSAHPSFTFGSASVAITSSLATTLTLSANPSSSTFGQQIALAATLNPYSAQGQSTNGEVITFYNGSGSVGTSVLSGGVAALNVTSLPTGTDSLKAAFAGDSTFSAATSPVIQIVVSAGTPAVTLSPASLAFPSQITGTSSAAQQIVLANSGQAPLSVTSISVSGDFTQTNTCSSSIAAGATCAISIKFLPTSVGVRTGTLSVTDNASGSPQSVAISGTGATVSPTITLSPSSLSFASQATGATSPAQTVTLTNSGQGSLALTSVTASGDFAQTNTCGNSLASGASCALSVTFTPTATGTRTGTLTITDNASGSPQTVALSGGGTAVAISSSSTGLTIVSAGGSATATIQVSSVNGFTGTVSLTCAVAYQAQGTPNSPPTCALNPSQAQLSGSSPASATLTVSTTAASASAAHDWPFHNSGFALAGLALVCLLPRRRWRRGVLLAALCLVCANGVIGCGGSQSANTSSSAPSHLGTTTGNYQVVVTANSGIITVSTTIPLTLQ
jgi:hypothetical protein